MSYKLEYNYNNKKITFNTELQVDKITYNDQQLVKINNVEYQIDNLNLQKGLNILKATINFGNEQNEFDIIVPYQYKKQIDIPIKKALEQIDMTQNKKDGKFISVFVLQKENYLFNKILIKKMLNQFATVQTPQMENLFLRVVTFD